MERNTQSNISELNNKLKLLNNQYKLSPSSKQNQYQSNNKSSLSNGNIKELLNKEIMNSNKINDKYNSLLTDTSVYVNNPYYSHATNKPLYQNTSQYNYLNDNEMNNSQKNNINFELNNKPTINDMNDMTSIRNIDNEANNRLHQFQFQNYHLKPNETPNKISPFDDRSKNVYIKKKNININSNNEINTPLGRAMATSHNIQFEINENLLSRDKNKITIKDIANERLNQFSPLARASQIPTKQTSPPIKTNEMKKFFDSYNTLKQSCLNTNYKKEAKNTNYNDINPSYVGDELITPKPENTRLI